MADAEPLIRERVVAQFHQLTRAQQREPALRHHQFGLEALLTAGDLGEDIRASHHGARVLHDQLDDRAAARRRDRQRVAFARRLAIEHALPRSRALELLLHAARDLVERRAARRHLEAQPRDGRPGLDGLGARFLELDGEALGLEARLRRLDPAREPFLHDCAAGEAAISRAIST